MSIHDGTSALTGDGTQGARLLARRAPFAEGRGMSIDDMDACGRAGTRGGGS